MTLLLRLAYSVLCNIMIPLFVLPASSEVLGRCHLPAPLGSLRLYERYISNTQGKAVVSMSWGSLAVRKGLSQIHVEMDQMVHDLDHNQSLVSFS